MLTILEAYNTIKALDTEPDIIIGACRKILGQDKKAEDTPYTIAREIILTYRNRLKPCSFVAALAIAAGIAAGLLAKDGKEMELLHTIMDVILEQMVKAKTIKLEELAKTDPDAALAEVTRQLKKIME